jgi:addiction module RelB/DinJ family antitoxin
MEAIVKSRIDLDLKTEAERVLTALGLTASDAIRMMFKQIAARQGLPLVAAIRANEEKLPSQDTDALFNKLSTKK